ncbi:hypothetical protein [Convivina praedatoris]|uniref:Uncharacterized protein n=1 Tax=Convivina praedatoris TaxID=2880963 RepID=A0ABN8H8I0_9LACO|nr:hypothetical protein [Convivina sp. LMG 32447]CAH1852733.1 hypothetical protein LMG032447_00648 [Convivina sp. LMG 32447]CAH1852765.1 hypothetical protein R078138_00658 [Convivina sp. LMG 32447]CAH1854793.1 hypothetical protein R077815_01083 [Convivina sp. LMG 32447]
MQNSVIQPSSIFWTRPKIKPLLKYMWSKFQVPVLNKQLTSADIIQRLELAVNLQVPVKLQINQSFYSETTSEYYGQLHQTAAGELYIYLLDKSQPLLINPALIRHIILESN